MYITTAQHLIMKQCVSVFDLIQCIRQSWVSNMQSMALRQCTASV